MARSTIGFRLAPVRHTEALPMYLEDAFRLMCHQAVSLLALR